MSGLVSALPGALAPAICLVSPWQLWLGLGSATVSESSESGPSWTLFTAASLLSKLTEDSVSESLGSPLASSVSARSSTASLLSKLSEDLEFESLRSPLISSVPARSSTPVDFVPVAFAVTPASL